MDKGNFSFVFILSNFIALGHYAKLAHIIPDVYKSIFLSVWYFNFTLIIRNTFILQLRFTTISLLIHHINVNLPKPQKQTAHVIFILEAN